MDARESAQHSVDNGEGGENNQRPSQLPEHGGIDEFSQRADFSSQGAFYAVSPPLLSVPSSQPLPDSPQPNGDEGNFLPQFHAPTFHASMNAFVRPRLQSVPVPGNFAASTSSAPSSIPPSVPVSQVPAGTSAAANSEGNARSGGRMIWKEWMITALIECKRIEWDEFESVTGRDHIVSSDVKWRRVQSNLREKGVTADTSQIKGKWEGVLGWYKNVKDWNNRSGNPSYDSLSRAVRKLAKLPSDFKEAWGDDLDSFYDRHASFAPPCVSESAAAVSDQAGGGSSDPNSPDLSSAVPQSDDGADGDSLGGTSSAGERPPGPSTTVPPAQGRTQ
ncbi:hypothetical protein R1sor_015559 [Riccia sorocarpa]|uniref:Myb-like domain-containing protein n=1 Tax=Riccia sorocarpa TaxID=122646 RepID=A0ABD3HCL0_9MARC